MKSSGIGGQAVLEGVMMKNKEVYAVAVRKPDGEIAIDTKEYEGLSNKIPFFKLPIIRGVVAFIESLTIGIKTLTYSASFYEEEEKDEKQKKDRKQKEKSKVPEGLINALTVLFSVCMAIGIFIVLPYFFSQILGKKIESQALLSLFEGLIRIALFIGYVVAISQMKDIRRVFMYHGAEHKTINCIEHGFELTVKNVKRQSKQHKRCGTSFMLIVMFVSIIFFIFIRVETPWLRLLLRLLLVPVIAGVSYEFLKLAGRSESKIVDILSKPGLLLQGLTTKEPDDSMIEVAIQSVEAVFDWRTYLDDNNTSNGKKNSRKTDKKLVSEDNSSIEYESNETKEAEVSSSKSKNDSNSKNTTSKNTTTNTNTNNTNNTNIKNTIKNLDSKNNISKNINSNNANSNNATNKNATKKNANSKNANSNNEDLENKYVGHKNANSKNVSKLQTKEQNSNKEGKNNNSRDNAFKTQEKTNEQNKNHKKSTSGTQKSVNTKESNSKIASNKTIVPTRESKGTEDRLDQELDNLDKILTVEKTEEMIAQEKQSSLKNKVRVEDRMKKKVSSEIAASLDPSNEEEEDDILRALDKYLDFESNKNS